MHFYLSSFSCLYSSLSNPLLFSEIKRNKVDIRKDVKIRRYLFQISKVLLTLCEELFFSFFANLSSLAFLFRSLLASSSSPLSRSSVSVLDSASESYSSATSLPLLPATKSSSEMFFFFNFTYCSKTFCNIFCLILGNYIEFSTITI